MYSKIDNDSIKESLINNNSDTLKMDLIKDQIRALESKLELRSYEVDMALHYIGETFKKLGIKDEYLDEK